MNSHTTRASCTVQSPAAAVKTCLTPAWPYTEGRPVKKTFVKHHVSSKVCLLKRVHSSHVRWTQFSEHTYLMTSFLMWTYYQLPIVFYASCGTPAIGLRIFKKCQTKTDQLKNKENIFHFGSMGTMSTCSKGHANIYTKYLKDFPKTVGSLNTLKFMPCSYRTYWHKRDFLDCNQRVLVGFVLQHSLARMGGWVNCKIASLLKAYGVQSHLQHRKLEFR